MFAWVWRAALDPPPPLQSTPAKSLMYECISTITYALQYTKRPDGSDAKNAPAVVRLCTDRLREMVRDPDANLKYLGLVGLTSLMRSNPRVVAEHRELVLQVRATRGRWRGIEGPERCSAVNNSPPPLQCLVDEDVTIRVRSLELITGMVTRRNLPDIVKRLLELLETAEVRRQPAGEGGRGGGGWHPPLRGRRATSATSSSRRSSSCARATSTPTSRTSRGTSPSSSSEQRAMRRGPAAT